ncbi:MAG: flagellar export chaperone FliS [Actinobacteria bacterium]|nr:flagellar export chaperone FliS [Actinomycetota bacterium]
MHPAMNPYQTQSVATAGPAQLVLMLFDRALVAVARASQAAGTDGRPPALETVNHELQRAQDILTELRVALDHEQGGDIAANLDALYDFCIDRLLRANISKDVSGLAPVTGTLQGLRDAWDEACCKVPVGVA